MRSKSILAINVQGKERSGHGVVLVIMHGRSRMTIDPCIPTMPARSTSGFHGPGRHCLPKRREVFGKPHEG